MIGNGAVCTGPGEILLIEDAGGTEPHYFVGYGVVHFGWFLPFFTHDLTIHPDFLVNFIF